VLTVADRPAELQAVPPERVTVLRTLVDMPWLPPSEVVARMASANHAVTKLGARFDDELAGWAPDIVHGHDWHLGWAADSLAHQYDVPFVLTMHGTERVRHGGQLPLGAPTDINSIEWWLAYQADRLISPTRFVVEQLVTAFELLPDHVEHIPNGIDPEQWRPAGEPRLPAGPRGALVVSWGRVQYEKGFQVLARAMHALRGRVPDVHAVIAGRGSYLPELQTQIDVEGVSDIIDLPGYLHDRELRQLVHRAGCVVIPSLYEPFGIVALEALAAGVPLIVARTGGLAELVAGTNAGVTFEPGNPDDLADAIDHVLTNPELATILVANARDLVQRKYAWDAIARSTADVYADLVARRLLR
jgi:glycogen(starch) synthase